MTEFANIGLRLLVALGAFAPLPILRRAASPREARGKTFFGVHVQPDFAESEAGVEIRAQFNRRLWQLATTAAVLALVLPPKFLVAALLTGIFGWVPFTLASARTRREAHEQGKMGTAPTTRVASLEPAPQTNTAWLNVLDWAAMLIPPLLPALMLGFIFLNWSRLPTELHSPGGVFPIWFALVLGLMCAANHWALLFRARSSDWAPTSGASHRFRSYLGAMQSLLFFFITSTMCFNLLLPLGKSIPGIPHISTPVYFSVLYPVEFAWIVAVFGLRRWLRNHTVQESSDPMADACWKFGFFYFNPADPALVVPLRSGVGQSHNYARPSVLAATGLVTVLTIFSLVRAFGLLAHLP
jgi:hypothetical protein